MKLQNDIRSEQKCKGLTSQSKFMNTIRRNCLYLYRLEMSTCYISPNKTNGLCFNQTDPHYWASKWYMQVFRSHAYEPTFHEDTFSSFHGLFQLFWGVLQMALAEKNKWLPGYYILSLQSRGVRTRLRFSAWLWRDLRCANSVLMLSTRDIFSKYRHPCIYNIENISP